MELKGDVSVLILSLFSKLLRSFKKCLKVYSHDLRVSVDTPRRFRRGPISGTIRYLIPLLVFPSESEGALRSF